METSHQRPRRTGHLPEVEGLRAVAVVATIVFHARLGMSGGFVGVDVFFVVSGFLITGLLLREFETTGTIRLREFYARRARRLLPAATLVLISTIVAARIWLDPLSTRQTATDAKWAAAFAANFHFAAQSTDYFHRGAAPSLVQHWWSLAVEEQFYFIWPAALLLVWTLGRRVARRVQPAMVALVLTGALASAGFLVGRHLTSTNPSWAYFASWSRGWELAAGALVAFGWHHHPRILSTAVGRRSVAGLGWLGLGAITFGALRFDSRTPFPGSAALLPVVGTVAVIVAIGAEGGPGRLLSTRPLQWIGGRSYGIYLWHWPLLTLVDARHPHAGPWVRLLMLGASVVAAALTYRLVENPIRHHARLVRSPAVSLTIGIALVAATLGTGTLVLRTTVLGGRHTGFIATALTPSATSPTTTHPATPGPTDTGADPAASTPATTRSADLLLQLSTKVRDELQPIIRRSIANARLPDNLEPPLDRVPNDSALELGRDCLARIPTSYNPPCVFGDPEGRTTIAIFGDSHSVQWFPALDRLGKERSWKVLVRSKAGCPSFEVTVRKDTWQDHSIYATCNTWRARTVQRLIDEKVDLVVISNYADHYVDDYTRVSPESWRVGMEKTTRSLTKAGIKVLVISDTPIMRSGPTSCLAWHPTSIDQCSVPRVQSAFTAVERDVATSSGLFFYDSTDWFCADKCPLVIGNLAVYFDWAHISRTYGLFLSPYLDLLIQSALASSAAEPPASPPTSAAVEQVGTRPNFVPAKSTSAGLLEQRVAQELQPLIKSSVDNRRLPDNLEPPLGKLSEDHPSELDNNCLAFIDTLDSPPCIFGDRTGSPTIALFGDSHATQWFPALASLAATNHWRLRVAAKQGCPSVQVPVRLFGGKQYSQCSRWRVSALDRLAYHHPDLVIISNYGEFYARDNPDLTPDTWSDGLARTIDRLVAAGSRVVVIGDTPAPGVSPAGCLSEHPTSIDRCAVARRAPFFSDQERRVAAEHRASFIDPTDWFCAVSCPAVVGNLAVYSDTNHLSRTYAAFLGPYLDLFIRAVLASSEPWSP